MFLPDTTVTAEFNGIFHLLCLLRQSSNSFAHFWEPHVVTPSGGARLRSVQSCRSILSLKPDRLFWLKMNDALVV
jgi:hypothetical protein